MNEPAPSPDPAALWALVRRWRERAGQARQLRAVPSGYLRGLLDGENQCADDLAALLPPEEP